MGANFLDGDLMIYKQKCNGESLKPKSGELDQSTFKEEKISKDFHDGSLKRLQFEWIEKIVEIFQYFLQNKTNVIILGQMH